MRKSSDLTIIQTTPFIVSVMVSSIVRVSHKCSWGGWRFTECSVRADQRKCKWMAREDAAAEETAVGFSGLSKGQDSRTSRKSFHRIQTYSGDGLKLPNTENGDCSTVFYFFVGFMGWNPNLCQTKQILEINKTAGLESILRKFNFFECSYRNEFTFSNLLKTGLDDFNRVQWDLFFKHFLLVFMTVMENPSFDWLSSSSSCSWNNFRLISCWFHAFSTPTWVLFPCILSVFLWQTAPGKLWPHPQTLELLSGWRPNRFHV